MAMHISWNVAHWLCLVGGLCLVTSALILRDVRSEEPPAGTMPPASQWGHRDASAIGRRAVLIAVGLAAAVYGVSRLLDWF